MYKLQTNVIASGRSSTFSQKRAAMQIDFCQKAEVDLSITRYSTCNFKLHSSSNHFFMGSIIEIFFDLVLYLVCNTYKYLMLYWMY